MSLIGAIKSKIASGDFEYSEHALDQSIARDISVSELMGAIQSGILIEQNPDDKYGPSCLILGWTSENRPIHVLTTYPARSSIKIITVYEPDPDKWVDLRKRKK